MFTLKVPVGDAEVHVYPVCLIPGFNRITGDEAGTSEKQAALSFLQTQTFSFTLTYMFNLRVE